jgi:hypothetical protein
MSAGGVLFESTRALAIGTRVELSIAWPARLDDRVRLRFCFTGCTVRSDGNSTVVQIQRYVFRTAGCPIANLADAGIDTTPAQRA